MRFPTCAGGCAALLVALLVPAAGAQTINQILDDSGDGTHFCDVPADVAVETAVEGAGMVYVTGRGSDNAFKITPGGAITEIIDSTGDGTNTLNGPVRIVVDASGNVYVTGSLSANVFKITPGGTITEIIDSVGDGTHFLNEPVGLAVDHLGNVYVAGRFSDNVFKITPGGAITEIIDSTGDGIHGLDRPGDVAVDAAGNVFVAGFTSRNVFKIAPGGAITEIAAGLAGADDVAVDAAGNVYVTGAHSDSVFKIPPSGPITEILGAADGLDYPGDVAVDAAGNVYVSGGQSNNAFKIATDGAITEIVDGTGDGTHDLVGAWSLAVEGSGVVYVAGSSSNNAFRITPPGMALSGIAGLVVPGFVVVAGDPEGPTTLFAVRNTSDQELLGRVDFYGEASELLYTDPFVLDPQATLTSNLRFYLPELQVADGVAAGFLVVTEIGGTTAPNLEGDYFRVDFGNDFATGDRLVRPADFCLRQELRFVDFGSGSELRILVNRPRGDQVPSFSYTAYDEAGTVLAVGDFVTSKHLVRLDIGELVAGENFGTVDFDFASSGGGWVCAKYSAFGRFSVELNAACRDR